MYNYLYTFLLCTTLNLVWGQGNGGFIILNPEGRFATAGPVTQSSGLALDPDGTTLWTHNDQGNATTQIYNFSPGTGQGAVTINKTVNIDLAANLDWEDMTKDNAGNLYIAQTGKNCNSNAPPDCPKRWVFAFHRVPFSSLTDGATVTPESFYFVYPTTGYPGGTCSTSDTVFANVEAAIWYNGAMYVFTKDIWSKPTNNCGQWGSEKCVLFKIPLTAGSSESNPIVAQYISKRSMQIFEADGAQQKLVISGAISPDQSTVALSTAGRLWLFYNFTGDDFYSGDQTYYTYTDDGVNPVTRGFEGMEFINNTQLKLSVDGVGGRVMGVDRAGLPLATKILKFNSTNIDCTVDFDFQLGADQSVKSVALQISTDGSRYVEVQSQTEMNGKFQYQLSGERGIFARLAIISENGQIDYSPVRYIINGCNKPVFEVFPNPTDVGHIYLSWKDDSPHDYSVQVRNIHGQIEESLSIRTSDRGMLQLHLSQPGVYLITVTRFGQPIFTQKIVCF